MTEIEGHAVRAVNFMTGVADIAIETGDTEYVAAAWRLWESATLRKMYFTGGVGSGDGESRGGVSEGFAGAYELANNSYCESCANCNLLNGAQRMMMLKPRGDIADVLERTLYNAVLHGISLDGKQFWYTNPLSIPAGKLNSNWLCCPPMLYRTLLGVGRYIYLHTDTSIYVNLYIGGSARIPLKGGEVTLRQQASSYPWHGDVSITVSTQRTEVSRFLSASPHGP